MHRAAAAAVKEGGRGRPGWRTGTEDSVSPKAPTHGPSITASCVGHVLLRSPGRERLANGHIVGLIV